MEAGRQASAFRLKIESRNRTCSHETSGGNQRLIVSLKERKAGSSQPLTDTARAIREYTTLVFNALWGRMSA